MISIRRTIALTVIALAASHPYPALPAGPDTAAIVLRAPIAPGEEDVFPALALKVRLNRIVRPGTKDAVAKTLTEYSWTLTNSGPGTPVRLTDAAVIVKGSLRRMGNPGNDLAPASEARSGIASVANDAFTGIMGLIGPGLGVAGAAAALTASDMATRGYLVDAPAAAARAIERRQFQQATSRGVVLLPSEAATGSVWMHEGASERAGQFRFFVRRGARSGVIELMLPAARSGK